MHAGSSTYFLVCPPADRAGDSPGHDSHSLRLCYLKMGGAGERMREAWPGQGFLFLAVWELTVTAECQVWLVGRFRLSRYGQKPSSPGAMLGPCEAGQVPTRSVGAADTSYSCASMLFPYFIPKVKRVGLFIPSYHLMTGLGPQKSL